MDKFIIKISKFTFLTLLIQICINIFSFIKHIVGNYSIEYVIYSQTVFKH